MPRDATSLLEREAPLAVVSGAWERAQAGGCIALVSGEAGIGKTALVSEFAASLGERISVSIGRCDALFTPRVLGPAHDVALRLGGELRRKIESGAARPAIFAAFLEALRGPARIVVFEDVHWADEATLDLVKYLGRRIGETRALLVLTYRDDEIHARHPLRLVLGDLPRERCVRVALEPLSLRAVEMLVAPDAATALVAPDAATALVAPDAATALVAPDVASSHVAPDVATRQWSGAPFNPPQLHAATGGNPFYLTEVLASGGGVPASVRDAVLARAGRLGKQARAAADLVSTAPGGLEASIVEECVDHGAEAIAECEERGVLRSSGGVLRFRHEIARLAILDALGAQRTRTLNGRVLEALRRRGAEGAEPARLAHHAHAAGEAKAAAEYATRAAKRAAALGAHREAADHYALAVRYSGHLPEAERAGLHDAYAWECHLTGRPESEAARKEAIAAWRRLGETAREAASLGRLAHLMVINGRDAEGEAFMREALQLLERVPEGPTHVLVRRFHAYIRMLERDVDVAISEARRALELAERYGDMEDRIHVLNTLGSSMLVADDMAGVEPLEKSAELALAAGFDYHYANAWGNLGSASGEVNRFKEAAAYLDRGLAWCEAHDLDNSFLYEMSWRALAHLFLGQWSDAGRCAGLVLDHPAASSIARIMALLAVGRLRARRGDPGVWTALDEAQSLAEQTGTLQRVAPMRAARAEAAWLAGEDAAAAREAAKGCELALGKRHAWFVGELAYWQWKGGAAVSLPDYAARPFALQVAGRWREAADEWKARSCPYETARALAEGDTGAKLEALAVFDRLEARPAAERVRQTLRAAGVRRIPRGPRASTRSHPAGLTAREAQILELIGQNLTNAQIAARLHISAKTVDHHVSSLLEKLGVGSRKEAVKAAL